MNLDAEALYRAVESRDRRFEGRFVLGVTTTGIYCRPGCPARLPRRENVRFFTCAAAAESTGFRPCRRCRPEASPGTPGSLGTGATVARALRLIDEGGLDGAGLDELAARLGLGGRHLRRLFVEKLGASPLAVARSRRVHFAKKLLDETDLAMAEVAASAGFGSLRRFNTEVRAVFQRSPTELRAGRKGPLLAPGDGSRLGLRLAYKPPHDWQSALAFLRALASAVRDQAITLDMPPSPEAERVKLAALPGIGAWTVEYIALRAFGEPDAFPAPDLALRKAFREGDELPSERAVIGLAEAFRPFRAYAAMHLWSSLSSPSTESTGSTEPRTP